MAGVALPVDLQVLARGWMHGNVVVIRGARPALVDTGYHTGVAKVEAAFEAFVGKRPKDALSVIALTHTHSDHAGGVAHLSQGAAVPVVAHADTARMVNAWDTRGMWLDDTGQQLPRYRVTQAVRHGEQVQLGDRPWRVVETPGHATGGIAWHDPATGVLICGDALWEDGFGILNPWLDGPGVFDDAARALDHIEATGASVVIPGHGAPFDDVSSALARARSRLAYLSSHPQRLQVLVIRSCAGFLALARPELAPADARAITLAMARSLGLPEETLQERVREATER